MVSFSTVRQTAEADREEATMDKTTASVLGRRLRLDDVDRLLKRTGDSGSPSVRGSILFTHIPTALQYTSRPSSLSRPRILPGLLSHLSPCSTHRSARTTRRCAKLPPRMLARP